MHHKGGATWNLVGYDMKLPFVIMRVFPRSVDDTPKCSPVNGDLGETKLGLKGHPVNKMFYYGTSQEREVYLS